MYNPGPLNAQGGKMLGGVTSHAEIGGDCKACHTAPWEAATMADRCIVCHTDIGVQMQDVAFMHGAIMHDNIDSSCRHCHPEHRGADAKLTEIDSSFDHNLSAFPLTNRHAGLACEQCHSSGQFVGLSTSCASCHVDPAYHAGMFNMDCVQCHTTENWSAGYNGPHPEIAEESGSGVNHGGASCRDCHTQTLHAATCTKCHEGNSPEGEH